MQWILYPKNAYGERSQSFVGSISTHVLNMMNWDGLPHKQITYQTDVSRYDLVPGKSD